MQSLACEVVHAKMNDTVMRLNEAKCKLVEQDSSKSESFQESF